MIKTLIGFTLLFFSISFSESFHILDKYNTNKTFSAKFTGVVKVGYFQPEFNSLGYGTVIKPWAILTSALIPYGKPIKRLIVYTNCKRKALKDMKYICNYKSVSKVVYQEGIEESKEIENFYAILIIPPYRINGRTQPLQLVSKYNIINYNDCFFVRWERSTTARYRYGVLKIPLSISSSKETDKYKIQDDYEKDSLSKMMSRHVLNKFNDILGAPLICQLKNSLDNYVQLGIAMINHTAYNLLNETNKFIVTDGSFVNITAVVKTIEFQMFQLNSRMIINKLNNVIKDHELWFKWLLKLYVYENDSNRLLKYIHKKRKNILHWAYPFQNLI